MRAFLVVPTQQEYDKFERQKCYLSKAGVTSKLIREILLWKSSVETYEARCCEALRRVLYKRGQDICSFCKETFAYKMRSRVLLDVQNPCFASVACPKCAYGKRYVLRHRGMRNFYVDDNGVEHDINDDVQDMTFVVPQRKRDQLAYLIALPPEIKTPVNITLKLAVYGSESVAIS